MYEDVKGKRLLIIGSDAGNVHIIDQAKKMGVRTIAIDWEKDHSKCPAKLAADEAWDMSYRDVDAVAERCKKEHVDGVLAGYAEYRVLCAARIAQKMGAPFYVTPEQMELTRNKRTFKELCKKYGVPVPEEYCRDGVFTEEDRKSIRYPVIVKPSDYGGRIGITVCHDESQLDDAIAYAMEKSESRTVVCEEYVTGTELMAIYTLSHGEISLSLINDKYLSKEGHKYEALCEVAMTPSKHYQLYMDTVDAGIREFIKGIGLTDGVAFFQMIAGEDKISVFEMGLRLNGGNDWKSICAENGTNYCEMLIRHSLTGNMGGDLSKDDPRFSHALATFVIYVHGGEVGKVEYKHLLSCPEIIDFHPYIYEGKVMPDNGTTQQKAFSVKIKAADAQGVADTIRFIQQGLVVEDKDGNNMLFADFDAQRLLA